MIEMAWQPVCAIGRARAAGQACPGRLTLARVGLGLARSGSGGSGGVVDAAQPSQCQLEPRRPRPAGRQSSVHRLAERVRRPGRLSRVRRSVLATTSSPRAPSPMAATQRSRLWARVAASSQAALAANLPEGQCRRPTPALRSRMHSSVAHSHCSCK
jgi:hypothetical protein